MTTTPQTAPRPAPPLADAPPPPLLADAAARANALADAARATDPRGFWGRWNVYQKERFPLLAHGPLIGAFSFCAVSYAARLRGLGEFPSVPVIAAAWVSALLFFLLLRIADEFKDADTDREFRPYRPVPRGLVSLREIGVLGLAALLLQALLAAWLSPRLLPLLAGVWVWGALMGREFFIASFLKRRPALYMLSHMAIVPMIDGYAAAWSGAGTGAAAASTVLPHALGWFLLVSYANGMVIEVGRKMRAPQNEEIGVETYSAAWGPQRAALVWASSAALSAVLALQAARAAHLAVSPLAVLYGALLVVVVVCAARYARRPNEAAARLLEPVAGVWTLAMYLGLGIAARL